MSFYSRMQKTSNKLLLGKGQTVTITHVVPGTYDPATGGVTNTTTTQTGTGAVMEWDARQVDGTLIKIGDKKLLLSPLNTAGTVLTAPVLGDTVTDAAGTVYTLVAPLSTLSPSGTAVLYTCNMRA
ncbi:MAG: hypothetical protein H8E17_08605 [Deltaproteobacteria bacterium]|nr:hypothetical protein [Deltaproteobacteria bacterium]